VSVASDIIKRNWEGDVKTHGVTAIALVVAAGLLTGCAESRRERAVFAAHQQVCEGINQMYRDVGDDQAQSDDWDRVLAAAAGLPHDDKVYEILAGLSADGQGVNIIGLAAASDEACGSQVGHD
jgi:hypothetical protein